MIVTLIGGISLIVTAVALMFWQILSAPDRPNYPTSGPIKRAFMFAYMLALYGRGAEVLSSLFEPTLITFTGAQFVAMIAQMGMFIAFLVDHCRNWLPARTQANVARMREVVRCGKRRSTVTARASALVESAASQLERSSEADDAVAQLRAEGAIVNADVTERGRATPQR